MKILILGFQRSGTTMLRRIMNKHPDMKIVHEKRIVQRCKTYQDMIVNIEMFFEGQNYIGEKIPYLNLKQPLKCIERWFDYFPKDGRVIHIVRHPIDVSISNMKKTSGGHKKFLKNYKKAVPVVADEIRKHKLGINIVFETLVNSPENEIKKILGFCNITYNNAILKKMIGTSTRNFSHISNERAYAFKKEGMNIETDINYYEILERIVDG